MKFMKYTKSVMTTGKWAKAGEMTNIKIARIISETNPQPSQFLDKDGKAKTQDVCKVQFEGINEPLNVSLNRATINGLVDAFGEDSIAWKNQPLAVETEKVRVAGKAVVALYLIPKGFKRVDDENGYTMIVKEKEIGKGLVAGGAPDEEYDHAERMPSEDGGGIALEEIPF